MNNGRGKKERKKKARREKAINPSNSSRDLSTDVELWWYTNTLSTRIYAIIIANSIYSPFERHSKSFEQQIKLEQSIRSVLGKFISKRPINKTKQIRTLHEIGWWRTHVQSFSCKVQTLIKHFCDPFQLYLYAHKILSPSSFYLDDTLCLKCLAPLFAILSGLTVTKTTVERKRKLIVFVEWLACNSGCFMSWVTVSRLHSSVKARRKAQQLIENQTKAAYRVHAFLPNIINCVTWLMDCASRQAKRHFMCHITCQYLSIRLFFHDKRIIKR